MFLKYCTDRSTFVIFQKIKSISIRVAGDAGYTDSHWSKFRSRATRMEIARFFC